MPVVLPVVLGDDTPLGEDVPLREDVPPAAPPDAPPAEPPPAPPPPAAKVQLLDKARAVANMIVVIFMSLVSLFVDERQELEWRDVPFEPITISSNDPLRF